MQEFVESVEDCLEVWPHIRDYANEVLGDLSKLSRLEGEPMKATSSEDLKQNACHVLEENGFQETQFPRCFYTIFWLEW